MRPIHPNFVRRCAALTVSSRKFPSAAQPQPKTILVTEGTEATSRSQSKAKTSRLCGLGAASVPFCDKNLHAAKQPIRTGSAKFTP